MKQFKPYRIVHLDIAGLQETELGYGNHYLVFHYRNIPLGHAYIDVNHPLQDYYADIFEAISPAVSHYAALSNVHIESGIKEDFIKGNPVQLLQLLKQTCFTPVALEENTISVVVCTRNRQEALALCLATLLNSSDKDFEIIVVDNAPENKLTQETVQRFPSVKYVL
ncbi:MAG: glycosyltransferase, partial [Pedobacter sp.]